MTRVRYTEEQKFNQWWIWLIILFASGLWIWQFVQQIILGIPFGDNPSSDLGVIFTILFPVLAVILFRILTLETIIDDNGVQYRFKPFQRKPRIIKADDIAGFEVKKYSPIKDYGGWGIRMGSRKKGKAYNVSGNQGVLFELKNGKKFLLGTQNPEAIRSALDKMMKRSGHN